VSTVCFPFNYRHSWAENTKGFADMTDDCDCAAGDRRKRDEQARSESCAQR